MENIVNNHLMNLMIKQSATAVSDYEFYSCVLVGLLVLFCGFVAVQLKYKMLDNDTFTVVVVSCGAVLAFFGLVQLCGHSDYSTAKVNPEFWAYKQLMMKLGMF